MEIDADRLREALNADREFHLQARYWNTQFRILTGTQQLLVTLSDGEVTSVDPGATPFDTWDFQLAGTDEHWAALLAPIPPPFFQDYYAAMLYHGFRIEGNMKMIMSYYPAVRRTRQVLAEVVARQEVAA
ncbi:hypothetical protein ACVGOW_14290 [Pseudonocardia saturnea]